MPIRPHLAYPVHLGRGGRLLTNEQGSEAEVADCIAAILSWPKGTRRGKPDFGVVNELFESGGPRLDEIRSAVAESEPRATEISDELLDATMRGGVARVSLGFDTQGES